MFSLPTLLLLALPCVLAEVNTPAPHLNPVAPCCLPWKMEGMVYNLNDQTLAIFAVDYNLQKVITRDPDHPTTGWQMVDFAAKKAYVHDGMKCTESPMPPTNLAYQRCLPKDATFVGDGSFGPVGGLQYNAYQFSMGGVNETIGVTKVGCVPVIVSTYASSGVDVRLFVNVDSNVTFTNFNVDTSNCVAMSVVG